MTNTYKHAERELLILSSSNDDPDNRPIIEPFVPELLALCEKFGMSGQSGGSAPFTASALAQALEHLCLQMPICDIMGTEDEWVDVTDLNDGETLFQNNRCSAVFKDSTNKAWYLDAVIWQTKESGGWYSSALLSNGEKIVSRQYIKQFPFTPKTFYIDVIEKEISKDEREFYVKDEKQLEEVFNYYDKS